MPAFAALTRLASESRSARLLLAPSKRAGAALLRQARLVADDLLLGAFDRAQAVKDRLPWLARRRSTARRGYDPSRAWRRPSSSASDLTRAVAAPEVRIDLVGTAASPGEVARLMSDLGRDVGCGDGEAGHRACAAARRLGQLARPSADVLCALEETVLAADRPTCVRRSAVDALARMDGEDARRALSRMADVTRQRVAWDGRPEDIELLPRLVRGPVGAA